MTRTACVFTACVLLGNVASAQQNRSWVSGVGDDANPCSRTLPCRTFQAALDKTDAGGVILVLDPGNYDHVVIDKPITISGVGTQASILATTFSGVWIHFNYLPPASVRTSVTLRNLQLNGLDNDVDGVDVDNTIATTVILDNVNVSGFKHGVTAVGPNKVSIIGGVISNNSGVAISAFNGASINVENAEIDGNNVAVEAYPGSTIRLSNSGIFDNKTGFACGGGTVASAGNNRKANNVGGTEPVCTPTAAITIQ